MSDASCLDSVEPRYLHLKPEQALPPLGVGPFKTVIIADQAVSEEWRIRAAEWIVANGCLYVVAWVSIAKNGMTASIGPILMFSASETFPMTDS